MKPICIATLASLLVCALIASAPAQMTTTEKGVAGGALLGAGTGAIVGAGVHHPIKGALIGGGLGAVAGGVVGHEFQNQEDNQQRLQGQVSRQQREIESQRAEIRQLQQEQTAPSTSPSNTTSNIGEEETE